MTTRIDCFQVNEIIQSSSGMLNSRVYQEKKTVLYLSLCCSRVTLKYTTDEICSFLHAQSNDLVGFSTNCNETGET